jgi:hypothetical protein
MSKAEIRLTMKTILNPVDFNVFEFIMTPKNKKPGEPWSEPIKHLRKKIIKRSWSWG